MEGIWSGPCERRKRVRDSVAVRYDSTTMEILEVSNLIIDDMGVFPFSACLILTHSWDGRSEGLKAVVPPEGTEPNVTCLVFCLSVVMGAVVWFWHWWGSQRWFWRLYITPPKCRVCSRMKPFLAFGSLANLLLDARRCSLSVFFWLRGRGQRDSVIDTTLVFVSTLSSVRTFLKISVSSPFRPAGIVAVAPQFTTRPQCFAP